MIGQGILKFIFTMCILCHTVNGLACPEKDGGLLDVMDEMFPKLSWDSMEVLSGELHDYIEIREFTGHTSYVKPLAGLLDDIYLSPRLTHIS